ncbi:MAG: LPS assembly protein LptD [Pseudomonadota bacterium]
MRRLWLALLVWLAAASHACAQAPALSDAALSNGDIQVPVAILADQVRYDTTTARLVATGAVTVLYEGARLSAERLSYNTQTGLVSAEGAIRLETPDGTTILASLAELDARLGNGLAQGVRLLVDDALQVAAARLTRSGAGRFNVLDSTVASTCRICSSTDTPLWRIRAQRVIQDTIEKQIYFENARFEFLGLPLLWLPQLRIADPSAGRATGLLVPVLGRSDIYENSLKLPYFVVLGDHADVTLTPFLTSTGGAILEAEFRQRYLGGGLTATGALAFRDGIDNAGLRGFLDIDATTRFDDGFKGEFKLDLTSDTSFLRQFDYSSADRLESFATISRYRQDDFTEFRLAGFQSLRDDEDNALIPFVLPEVRAKRYLDIDPDLGRLSIEGTALGLVREDGRNVARFTAGADWRKDVTLDNGMQVAALGAIDAQYYRVTDVGGTALSRVVPTLGLEWRFPLVKRGLQTTQIIEPIAQVLFTGDTGDDTAFPNEDSLLPELDETNLFALNRFPGLDVYETGLRANIGARYILENPGGWSFGVTVGQVVRADPNQTFATGTGLAGSRSDLVAAVTLALPPGVTFGTRALLDNSFDFRRAEADLEVTLDRFSLEAGVIYLAEDTSNPILGNVDESSELTLDTSWDISDQWSFKGAWRYNLTDDRSIRYEGRLSYGNECIRVDLSATRRFTTSSDVPPSTSFGLSVQLAGLGAGTAAARNHSCTPR